MEDLHYQSLVDVAGAIRRRDVSPVEVTGALLDRIEALDGDLNSYITVTADIAMDQAKKAEAEIMSGRYRGPMHGIPIGIKDLCFTKGVKTTFGMRVLKDFVPNHDGTVAKRLNDAGAVMLGKLHLHEGAFGEHHRDLGNPLNPWNKDYWPGGSSSGSGVATAAGLCYASIGTDTGGSIRFPSHACGVTGVKVTWGRVSRYGAFPLAESLDTIGPMARSAADCAAMLGAFAGYDPNDPTSLTAPVPDYLAEIDGVFGARGMRIGVDMSYIGEGNDAETVALIEAAAEVFQSLGAELKPFRMPDVTAVANGQLAYCQVESATFHEDAYKAAPGDFGKLLGEAVAAGLVYDPVKYAGHQIDRDIFKGKLARTFLDVDAIIVPVFPGVGVRYDEFDSFMDNVSAFLRYTGPFNMAGTPTVTLPCGFSSLGLPVGFQLVGPHLSEAKLLRAAHAYQQATDWHLKRPPIPFNA
ncbi:amidase [Chthonobacter albigriseus]|uniref:amidase n=1 Tax=Chthonobacter albigriseus TaxID=1683161 RepID=UPI0015EEB1FC|nr:amidase [Chthonobacter albigriseus]